MAEVIIIDTTKPDDRDYNVDLVRTVREFDIHPAVISYVDAPHMQDDLDAAEAVIVSGVPLYYPSETAEELRPMLEPILHDLVLSQTPTLAICLGHQVLGLTFGAKLQREVEIEEGVIAVTAADGQAENPLLQGLGVQFSALSSHWASIDTTEADDLIRVASSLPNMPVSTGCQDEIVQVKGAPMWGVQFHPEKITGEIRNDGKDVLGTFLRVAKLID